jgi:signal recognition particle subunit SEC65
MKYLSLIIALFVCFRISAQSTEFVTYPNGLIYSESTIHELNLIVDSLNLKYKVCDLEKPYLSLKQGEVYVVDPPKSVISRIKKNEISIEEFLSKHENRLETKAWMVKSKYENYNGDKMISLFVLPSGDYGDMSFNFEDKKRNNRDSGWIFIDQETALYLDNLESKAIPEKYGKLVQYVDCMIDTTAQIYLTDTRGEVYQRVDEDSKASEFIKWTYKFPGAPDYPEYGQENFDSLRDKYMIEYGKWDSTRLATIDNLIVNSQYYSNLLDQARVEALENGNSSSVLEYYVARYISKEDALQLKRNRRVVGGCSMDMSPRIHAMEISTLAAETAKWDIFLRAHLDVMNDRFDRVSDGSYAFGARKTYLKEIEVLGINTVDLMMGISLRVDNVSENHYFGSVSRVGRAISESSEKQRLEELMIAMIKDNELDPYNRLIMVFLYYNYAHHLPEDEIPQKIVALNNLVKTLPGFMQDALGSLD